MDYKKIIKSRKVRIAIMNMMRFIPDKAMISIQYKMKTGRKMNWNSPQRFTEKLQVYKLKCNVAEMRACVDKYDVRKYVTEKGLSDILVGLIGIYNDPSEIIWEDLPNKFVAKDTLGCGGNSVIICRNKEQLDKNKFYNTCQEWVNENSIHPGREHAYEGKKHRIIIEEYLEPEDAELGLVDYKFFCFQGKAEYLYVISNRKLGVGAEFGIYSRKYELLPYYRSDELKPLHEVNKPDNYEKMLEIAETLAGTFPEVRVDLYSVKGKTYFGEMTFFDGSGYMTFEPDKFDFMMGEKFKLQ